MPTSAKTRRDVFRAVAESHRRTADLLEHLADDEGEPAGTGATMTVPEAAKRLGYHRATLNRLMDEGSLKWVPGPSGGKRGRRITERALDAYLNRKLEAYLNRKRK